jgi:antitoxin HicB
MERNSPLNLSRPSTTFGNISLAKAMKKKNMSKKKMAGLLKTSRTQVDRLLDAKNDITLSSLQRAAAIVGRRVLIELV